MTNKTVFVRVALARNLPRYFDYLPPEHCDSALLQRGMRVCVPFGRGNNLDTAVIIELVDETDVPINKLKQVVQLLDEAPIFDASYFTFLRWAHRYYHYPLGLVIHTALPRLLNAGQPAQSPAQDHYFLTEAGQHSNPHELPARKARQAAILTLLQENLTGVRLTEINFTLSNPQPTLKALEKQNLIYCKNIPAPPTQYDAVPVTSPLTLNNAQQTAVEKITNNLGHFSPFLLDGVTGSGKTEVYLQAIQAALAKNLQVLVLVPEINLTPQMIQRFKQRFAVPIEVLHSNLNDKARLHAWLSARDGHTPIIIGTRSAIWTPLARLGLIIVDEEHDNSYKQQDNFRYSARDLAVIRAREANVPLVLGSATPSLETFYNTTQQRYQHLPLPERAGNALPPEIHLIDMRHQLRGQVISIVLRKKIQACLDQKQQAIIFINRRGYAPVIMCTDCSWMAHCKHCDAKVTYHEKYGRLYCHHCGASAQYPRTCPDCQSSEIIAVGVGTERLESQLAELFPTANILRVDSDSVNSKQTLERTLDKIHSGQADILVGTQMLAKGHHFPNVTLVGIINADGGLFGVDFRAGENMAQLIMQVAGRAGREQQQGHVYIQTHHPEHDLLKDIVQQDYHQLMQAMLQEREHTFFPPYTYIVLLRAEAQTSEEAYQFLSTARSWAESHHCKEVELLGPVASPMERRAKWFRAQLLIQSAERKPLHHLLSQWLPQLYSLKNNAARLRWSVDIDPQTLL